MNHDEFVAKLSTKTLFLEEDIVKFMALTRLDCKDTEEVLMNSYRKGVFRITEVIAMIKLGKLNAKKQANT